MKKLMLVAVALLPLAACTSATPTPSPTAAAADGAYAEMSCAELDAAARSAASDAAWARRQQQETFSGQVSSSANITIPITGGRDGGASPNASRARQQESALRQAMTAKGCL